MITKAEATEAIASGIDLDDIMIEDLLDLGDLLGLGDERIDGSYPSTYNIDDYSDLAF